MNTIFMNSKNSKTFYPHRLLLNLKINLRRKDKSIFLSNLKIYYTWKNIKKSFKNNNKKTYKQNWIMILSWTFSPWKNEITWRF